jgi:hypothetical protein
LSAQAISLVGDRDIGNFIQEALTRSVEKVAPLFSQAFSANLRWIVLLNLLTGNLNTKFFQDGLDHLRGVSKHATD